MDQRFPHITSAQVFRRAATVLLLCVTFGGMLLTLPFAAAAVPGAQDEIRCAAPKPAPFAGVQSSDASPALASPVASPLASPAAIPAESDSAGSGEAEIELVVRTVAVCQSESRVKTFSRFVTENFLGDVYAGGGSITRDQFVELAKDLPNAPVAIISVSNIEIDPNGTATADVVSTYGRQLLRARWSFVFVPTEQEDATGESEAVGTWWPDGVTPLPVEPPSGAGEIEVVLDENTYDPDALRVRGPDIVLAARNRGDEDHEMLVLQFRHDVTTSDLLTAPGPALPNGVTVIGQLTVPAGTRGELVLVGVERGEYVIVDLLPSADGTPHLALGMDASLTVR